MIIHLTWPDSSLLPNRRRGKKLFSAATVKSHRHAAYITTLEVFSGRKVRSNKTHEDIYCRIVFHPPDRRRRDLDGMLSSCKPYLDGIADALGIDDRQFNPIAIERREPIKKGEVVIEI